MGFKKRMRNDVGIPANNKRSTNVLRSNPAIDFRYATLQFDPMSGQSKKQSKCPANPKKRVVWSQPLNLKALIYISLISEMKIKFCLYDV